ncbi:glycoside hydrolase family 16 protein [Phlegmacium glaucopus]|nr:glycoside hydrolase family 16 protein [Phlegmacium glaucopus]
MKSVVFAAAFLALSSFTPALANIYLLNNRIIGPDFYNNFDWEAIADPTNGRVNYVNQAVSDSQNLTFASSDTFILRTDFRTVLSARGPGRNSVRLRSKNTYTTHVAVFDVRHMPQGCGTWPAIWEVKGSNWPEGGEVDIVEGVNDQTANSATLHTTPGCTMPPSGIQTGTPGQLDCNTAVNSNTGCTVEFPTAQSFGPPFNSNGGGWFAIERTTTFIKVWFWARNDNSVPLDIKSDLFVNTDSWGTPTAAFPDTSCDIPEFFQEHNIVINLTLCGDWAGSVYSQDGCPSTCVDFVNNNPSEFQNAYFDFASIRVYT